MLNLLTDTFGRIKTKRRSTVCHCGICGTRKQCDIWYRNVRNMQLENAVGNIFIPGDVIIHIQYRKKGGTRSRILQAIEELEDCYRRSGATMFFVVAADAYSVRVILNNADEKIDTVEYIKALWDVQNYATVKVKKTTTEKDIKDYAKEITNRKKKICISALCKRMSEAWEKAVIY